MSQQVQESNHPAKESDNPATSGNDHPVKESELIEVAGQKLTPQQLKDKYVALEKDYTQKSQKLAQAGKPSEQQYSDDDLVEAAKLLEPILRKTSGFVTQDDLEMRALVRANPNLRGKEKQLKDLASLPDNQGKAIEDIIDEYNLNRGDKLERARTRDAKGNTVVREPKKAKPINEMTTEEYLAFKKEKGIGQRKVLP